MATLIYDYKLEFQNYIIDIKAWEIRKGEYKYSFVLIKNGKRILGFDNHEKKEPHIHIRGEEKPYSLTSIHQALNDFWELAEEMIENEKDEDKV